MDTTLLTSKTGISEDRKCSSWIALVFAVPVAPDTVTDLIPVTAKAYSITLRKTIGKMVITYTGNHALQEGELSMDDYLPIRTVSAFQQIELVIVRNVNTHFFVRLD